tara:strand:- start:15157 stop:15339 length:183 start_codon:yes stop_codon:yes gene_type:complete
MARGRKSSFNKGVYDKLGREDKQNYIKSASLGFGKQMSKLAKQYPMTNPIKNKNKPKGSK